MVCARVQTTKAFPLEAFAEQEDRVRAWADVTTAVARVNGVARVQASDQTTIVSGARGAGLVRVERRGSGGRA